MQSQSRAARPSALALAGMLLLASCGSAGAQSGGPDYSFPSEQGGAAQPGGGYPGSGSQPGGAYGGGYGYGGGYAQQGGGYGGYVQQGGGYVQQGGGYTQGYYPPWHPMPPVPRPTDQGRLGRTLGGAAGLAAGAMGGLALGTVLVRAAGIAALGPLAPMVVLGAMTAGGAWIGAKGLSLAGIMGDKTLGKSTEYAMMGAIAGAVLGFTLLPALGPFAGPLGRVFGAALGGVAGGILGKLLAPALDKIATPEVLFGATGAVVGGMGFGVPGALAGAAGGYALGGIMDKGFYADPRTQPAQVEWDIRDEFAGFKNRIESYGQTVSDWVHNSLGRFGDRARNHWDQYDYPSYCYDDYSDSRRYVYEQLGYSPAGPGQAVSSGSSGSEPADLVAARDAYYAALAAFQKVQDQQGSQADQASAYNQVQQTEAQYARLRATYGGR